MRTIGLLVACALVLTTSACGADDDLTASAAAKRLQGAIASVTKNVTITKDNDPNDLIGKGDGYVAAHVLYDARVQCSDGLGADCGATVEQWPSEDDAETRAAYLKAMLDGSTFLGSEYDYQRGNLVLRVSGDLEKDEAAEYERYFNADDAPRVTASERAAAAPKPQGRIIESGFAQDGEYANAVALVENTSDHGGQTVIVNFDFVSANGTTIKSQSQTEGFSAPGERLAVVGFTDFGSGTPPEVAKVRASIVVKDQGFNDTHDQPLGTAPVTVRKGDFGWEAKYTVHNPTGEPLESPRVGIICKDAHGRIVGVGDDYPGLVPAHGSFVSTDAMLTIDGQPKRCTAYVGWPM